MIPEVPAEVDAPTAAQDALASTHCPHCGHRKKKGDPLCLKCRHLLAQAVSPAVEPWINLYRPIGKGFEETFAAALKILAALRDMETVPLFVAGDAEGVEGPALPSLTQ